MAKRAFEQLTGSLSFEPDELEAEDRRPPCLQKVSSESFIPCLICGKLFKSCPEIMDHSNIHLSDLKVSKLFSYI
jgi:hypothetical protein